MNNLLIKILALILFLCAKPVLAQPQNVVDEPKIEYANGVVLEILSEFQNETLKQAFGDDQKVQYVQVKVTTGSHKGKVITVLNQRLSSPIYDIDVKKGDRIILDIEEQNGVVDAYIADKQRIPVLLVITGLFFLLLLIIGGRKGLNSLVSILITAFLVFSFLIPNVLSGGPVIFLTIVMSIVSTTLTMFTIGGVNKKSLSASLGVVISLISAGLLSMFVIKFGYITGFSDQTSVILYNTRPDLNFKGIVTAAMIIAALGAIMDVGMSISSCINEIKLNNPELSQKELAVSGMNVGKDIIGTMSNTLILAYIGASFHLMLLSSDVSMIKFLNLNSVVTEISSALVGSIGLVLCVPITAFIASYLFCLSEKKSNIIEKFMKANR